MLKTRLLYPEKSLPLLFEPEETSAAARTSRHSSARSRFIRDRFRWDDQGGLHTSQVREVVVTHPVTGEQVWFNQVEQWHPSMLDQKNRRAMAALGLKEEDLPHYASFGDGSPLDEAELNQIRTVMREQAVYFPWQKSDLLVLDNVLVAHGRNSFKGPRKIRVAMG